MTEKDRFCPMAGHDFDFELDADEAIPYLWFKTDTMLAIFNFREQRIAITKMVWGRDMDQTTVDLPIFDPDFSDMRALISKLKTYALFS